MSDERTTIVTGGTGALGRAVVRAFLEAGDRVIVPWIERSEADALASDEKPSADAGRLVLVEADVADEEGAARAASAAGAPEVLVNAAGGFGGPAKVGEDSLELWDRLYRTNLRTAASSCRAVAPGMRERGRGAIVNVTARPAFDPPAMGLAAYSASKAGVAVLTEALQRELADAGVRVNAVSPVTIDTPANREAMPKADSSQWTPPAEIARVVLWLASREAATVRGAVVPV